MILRPTAPAPVARRAAAPVLVATGVGVLLAGLYLLLPRMGTDLSAQLARAQFAERYGLAPIDFGWYGGTQQFGYSLLSQHLLAGLGIRLAGAAAVVGATAALTAVLVRTSAPRPLVGGILVAVGQAGNLVSGRTTFALGTTFGLVALLALTLDRDRRQRLPFAGATGLLAAATSPVAGLFTGLAGVALMLSGRRRDGLVLAVAAGIPLAVTAALFGEGGYMNFPREDLLQALTATVLVLLLVPQHYRTLRTGAALYLAGLLAGYLVHTPVGSNATRLAVVFALPVLAATVTLPARVLASTLAVLATVSPPLLVADLRDAGSPASRASYFRPLLDELARRGPLGRVEVPALRDYWEAAYVAPRVPLARGWLRQVDNARNPLFFDGSLTTERYRSWLVENGVSYVALPAAELAWVSRGEGRLVRSGLPYLRLVWQSPDWQLYQVDGEPSIVDGAAAALLHSDAGGLTVQVQAPGSVLLRVRYSRWLTVGGGPACLAPEGRWTRLDAAASGTYQIGSSLSLRARSRCQ